MSIYLELNTTQNQKSISEMMQICQIEVVSLLGGIFLLAWAAEATPRREEQAILAELSLRKLKQHTTSFGSGSCTGDQFNCDNKLCINAKWVCDNDDDCGDMSDEAGCGGKSGVCLVTEHQCDNNKCISPDWLCDGEDDCGDGSDEKNC